MSRHHHRTVEDLMTTNVVSIKEADPIAIGLDLMVTSSVHHLPVVDSQARVVGMLSDRDLLRGLAGDKGRTDPVGTVMSRHVRAVASTTHAHVAAKLMMEGGFNALPVVGPDGVVAGMITSSDFLAVAESALRGVDVASSE